jgi:hypothetical protein
MRRPLGCRLVAAAVAAVALHAAARAADPVPAAPAPAAPVAVRGSGGCPNGDCGGFAGPGAVAGGHRTAHRGFVMGNAAGGYFTDACQFGRRCNNGCGSLRSDAGFVLGSCRSFFAPCGPGLLDCGHGRGCGGGLFGKCPKGGPGVPPAGPFDPCLYDSYLNH